MMATVDPLSTIEELQLANFLITLNGPVEFQCEYRNWSGAHAESATNPEPSWRPRNAN